MMSRIVALIVIGVLVAPMAMAAEEGQVRRISVAEYRDKMMAGWIGQMVGVGWGEPTEFHYLGRIIPEDEMPEWRPEMVNMFHQDDLYVEMTFLRTLEEYGFDVCQRQAGIDFANSEYPLWHANDVGRENLRGGIAPPDSGHPHFNDHADDIDYQIEADFSGLIAPGMPNLVIELGELFGRLMNYGDGVYGGQFVGGMYAEAFFTDDPLEIVEAGLACIPTESQYAECIRDTIRWWQEHPDDWTAAWELIEEKYNRNPDYRRASCRTDLFNIDAKINGAYIVMGLLYGQGDLDETIIIATRCGQDSDCNPSNAGGILFTTVGFDALPERFIGALDRETKFSHTAYDFDGLAEVCEQLARDAVVRQGGRIEQDTDGHDVFVIPVQTPQPSPLEQSWEPGPIANSRFTDEEMAQIRFPTKLDHFTEMFPGWALRRVGPDMGPGPRDAYRGRTDVYMTHPLNRETGCVLYRTVAVPEEGQTTFRAVVTHDTRGDFTLLVRVDGDTMLTQPIGPETVPDEWTTVEVDLSPYAGREILLEAVNQADGWEFEAAYWAELEIVTE